MDEGQHDEREETHQCYFVAIREACTVAGLGVWPAAVITHAILNQLHTQHWTDFFESPVFGHVMVGQGPPGAPPRAGQEEASCKEHLARPGAHGGEPLTPVLVEILKRPVLLITGTTASIQMRLYTLPDEKDPHGRHLAVQRRGTGFWYRPAIREQWVEVPEDALILAFHGWHYTTVRRWGPARRPVGHATARATTPARANDPGGREDGQPGEARELLRDWAVDNIHGLANFRNTCAINALAQALLCPIIEDFGRGLGQWDSEDETLCGALVGASTARGPDGRAQASATLTRAMEDGGQEQLRMAIGNNLEEHGPQLDMEEMMERALAMVRGEHPDLLTSVDWQVACLGICRNGECGRLDGEVRTTVPCNPIALQPRPEDGDSSQEMVNRMMA